MIPLPSWDECQKKVIAEEASALELFIHNNEPAEDAERWRNELWDALNEAQSLN